MSTKKYYGKNGPYLKEHEDYLTKNHLKRDAEFIIKSLGLTKKDRCLDLQCAQGRLTIELARRGFMTDGLDYSDYMLSLARRDSARTKVKPEFFKGDLNRLQLLQKYTKVAMYFPDWDGINLDKLLSGVNRVMKRGGLFLCDQDNLYRIWNYLSKNPKAPYRFDSLKMELVEKGEVRGNRYYVFPEMKKMFEKAGFKIVKTYGGWSISDGEYRFDSPRLRIVAKKI